MKQAIVYKEWAPDQPDLGPDLLTVAKNTIPSPSGYKSFRPFAAGAATAPYSVVSNAFAANSETKGTQIVYVSFNSADIYASSNFGAFASRGGATVGAEGGMAQFDN